MNPLCAYVDELASGHTLSKKKLLALLRGDKEADTYLHQQAEALRKEIYGNEIYIRGLLEVSNCCKNNCYYCGIRRSNSNMERYRLSAEEIYACCATGYELGFRTFVLQGGEDLWFTDERIAEIIREIKRRFPDCAITLSLGERSYESYQYLYEAGADRYLLREETSSSYHYHMLHPACMSFENRQQCLWNLKKIGYQTGGGFMVGSPAQSLENLVSDLMFLKELQPHMMSIGPFIPHEDTPFGSEPAGSVEMTLRLISILRLLFPDALLPSTAALETLDPQGHEKAVRAGANVIMSNLTPSIQRRKYRLYNNMAFTGAEELAGLQSRMEAIGYRIVTDRGDCKRGDVTIQH